MVYIYDMLLIIIGLGIAVCLAGILWAPISIEADKRRIEKKYHDS